MAEPDKKYDLEERTALFAERLRDFCFTVPKKVANAEYLPQLIRTGANYIEANESIGDKDFKMKIKTCRRESKESAYWLRLVVTDGSKENGKRKGLSAAGGKRIYFNFYSNSKETGGK